MNAAARLYISLVSASFLAALVVAGIAGGAPGLGTFERAGSWIALAILAEALVVHQQNGGGGHISFSAAIHTATAIVLGPFVAALVAALGVIVVDGSRRKNPNNVALNASMLGAAAGGGGLAYQLLGGESNSLASTTAALTALVVLRFAINTLLYAGIASAATGRPPIALIEDEIWSNGLAGVAEGSLGVLLGLCVQHGLVFALPFLLPLLAAIYTARSKYEQLWSETHKALDTFAEVIDERDPSTARHSERVTEYVERFSTFLGLSDRQTERLVESARYHDLGKIAVDVATLSASRRLEPHELQAIRSHPRISARLLTAFAFAKRIARYVELHHERFDGAGYYKVATEEIPVEAHVLIIADSFDAMTSERAYRPALTLQEAVEDVRDKAGTQFHPVLGPAFAAMIEGKNLEHALDQADIAALRAAFDGPHRFSAGLIKVPVAPALLLLAITAPLGALAVPSLRMPALAVGATLGLAAALVARRGESQHEESEQAYAAGFQEADCTPPQGARCVLIALDCFDRIRAAAGQLTAEHAVAHAKSALVALVGDRGTVEQTGDDGFILRLDEAVWHEIVPTIGPTLSRTPLPSRVHPIAVRTTFLDDPSSSLGQVA
jgi:HD-GYP domain-containing protein (c-di-GMP phosphodiesterase class II)